MKYQMLLQPTHLEHTRYNDIKNCRPGLHKYNSNVLATLQNTLDRIITICKWSVAQNKTWKINLATKAFQNFKLCNSNWTFHKNLFIKYLTHLDQVEECTPQLPLPVESGQAWCMPYIACKT
jgi:hypothetical protein